jgi:phosphatidylglycerol---prolipoprotein diacylglyceryl transferase
VLGPRHGRDASTNPPRRWPRVRVDAKTPNPMHPILFRVPLPGWTIPLFPALLGIALLAAVVALIGWRKRAIDLLAIGGAGAVASGIAAILFRGQDYALAPLPIYSYGAMLCLSIIIGWFLTLGLSEKDGLPRETMANCYFVTALSALVGARLLYVFTNLQEFQQFWDLFALRRGGLVAYGGFLGGFVGALAYLRRHKLRLLPWADVAVPSLALGLVVTRIGCYLFGCDFGAPLAEGAPRWLARLGTFPRWPEGTVADGAGSPAFIQHVNERGLSPDAMASLPVHPTQIYESLAGLALLALVFLVRRKQRFRGEVFLAFTFGYGLLRFLIETVRDDLERRMWGPYVAEHLLLPLALVAFGAAFAYGPARAIAAASRRRAVQAAGLVPAVVAFALLRPASFAADNPIQLSTSQWIALCTALAAGFAWSVLHRNALANPESAMALDLPVPAPDPGAAEGAELAPRGTKKRKRASRSELGAKPRAKSDREKKTEVA